LGHFGSPGFTPHFGTFLYPLPLLLFLGPFPIQITTQPVHFSCAQPTATSRVAAAAAAAARRQHATQDTRKQTQTGPN